MVDRGTTPAREAQIVDRGGLLELRRRDGKVLRQVVYPRSSPSAKRKAHDWLVREATELGHAVIQGRWEGKA